MKSKLKPSVTVLMPVYNAEKFLDRAVRSILDQTYTDFEFLIIDDGSTDASVEIIESYNDPRILFIRNDRNYGISATLNKGIEMARGELIARMDADDWSYPERLEKQFAYLSSNPDCALLATWAREISESGAPLQINRWKSSHYYYNLVFNCWIYHDTVMYCRDAVIAAGKYVLPYSEDFELWNRMARQFKIATLEEVLLDNILTDVSLTRETKKTEYETEQTRVIRSNIDYFTGGSVDLSHAEIEFFQNNYDLLFEENSLVAIAECFKKLDRINEFILNKPNPNRDETAIQEAAREKKRSMLEEIRQRLTKPQQLKLLSQLGEWREIGRISGDYLLRRVVK